MISTIRPVVKNRRWWLCVLEHLCSEAGGCDQMSIIKSVDKEWRILARYLRF
jgi:hypothetical protein